MVTVLQGGVKDPSVVKNAGYQSLESKSEFDPLRFIAPYISGDTVGCNALRVLAPYLSRAGSYQVSLVTYSDLPKLAIVGIGHAHRQHETDEEFNITLNSGGCLLNTANYPTTYNPHILAAWAAGIPVATLPCGKTDPYLQDSYNCLILDLKNVWGSAERAVTILQDPVLATALVEAGRKTLEALIAGAAPADAGVMAVIEPAIQRENAPVITETNTRNPRILIYHGGMDGCGFYRIKLPYEALAEKYKYDVVLRTLTIQEEMDWADIIIFQRQVETGVLNCLRYAKAMGKKTIYELDDFFHGIPRTNPAIRVYPPGSEKLKTCLDFIKECDIMTVSTEGLAKEYGFYAKKMVVLRNAIEPSLFPARVERNDGKIRIGWAGSSSHLEDIKLVVDALTQILLEREDVELYFIGADWRPLFPESVRGKILHDIGTFKKKEDNIETDDPKLILTNKNVNPNCVTDYYDKLARASFDIGIAPVYDSRFNVSKSDVKCLEYLCQGVPAVASKLGEYSRFEFESEGGCLLAKRHLDWIKQLRKLIDSAELRKEIGAKGKTYVLSQRTVSNNVEHYNRMIRELL